MMPRSTEGADGAIQPGAPSEVPPPSLRFLGLDPGLERTGYGIVEGDGSRPRLVEAGVLRVPTRQSLAHRLRWLFEATRELMVEYRPAAVAIEEIFSHVEYPRTAIWMGHARGVLFLAAAQSGVDVSSYLPTRVKKSMTGNGRASKQQVQRAVQAEFGIADPLEPADVADALAVAVCHFHSSRASRAGWGHAPR